jgi:hypothetical protein
LRTAPGSPAVGSVTVGSAGARPVDVPAPRAARVSAMQKWEYVTVPLLVHATKQILDSWGDQGYELVTVIPGPNPEQLVAYLKRPKGEG